MTGMVDGKVALVTGAASGIGHATALALAREGARVLLADTDDPGCEKAVAAIRDAGGEAHAVHTDVTQEPQVEAMVALALTRFGRLDCAVNNAGVNGAGKPVHVMDLEEWSRTLSINLTGTFLCVKHELPVMQKQGGGAIVNVSSGAGVIGAPGLADYCASKHAVLGLTRAAALENARSGVRVNAICPGSTDTPMLRAAMASSPGMEKLILASQPGGRLGRPEEIAEAAVWLCSDRSSFVTGDSLLVDGGSVAR